MVDTRDGQMVSMLYYNITLEDGRWTQVQWDWVQKDYGSTP